MPIITKIVGSKSLLFDLSGKTVQDLIDEIIEKYGANVGSHLLDESGKLDAVFKILINEKEWIRQDKMNKALKEGDRVTLMMLVAGG
jgi:molybdopterin converting factor small subunit